MRDCLKQLRKMGSVNNATPRDKDVRTAADVYSQHTHLKPISDIGVPISDTQLSTIELAAAHGGKHLPNREVQ